MKLAIVGSRTFNNKELLETTLDNYKNKISLVVSGGAKGADSLAENWARDNGVPTEIFKPEWSKYGRSAALLRNRTIIENCDECLAFWDGESRGTFSSISLCNKLNKKVTVIIF